MEYTQMNLRSGRMAQVRRKEESRKKIKDVDVDIRPIKSRKSRGRIKDKSSIGWMFR